VGKLSSWTSFWKSREGKLATIEINGHVHRLRMTVGDSGRACFSRASNRLKFTPDELEEFPLVAGVNRGVYRVPDLDVVIPFYVFLLERRAKLVITDVDGTITKDDVTGEGDQMERKGSQWLV